MNARTRILQVVYLALLAVASNLASPPVAAGAQLVFCNVCVSQCSQAAEACTAICEAGTTVQWQCWGSQSCAGQGGGTYEATVRCTVDVP
jgi:hypothetical protein